MRIAEAARALGTTPRALRYREQLGLLPRSRNEDRPAGHRRYADQDLTATRLALTLEHRYDVPPASIAFALRVLEDPRVAGDVRELGVRIGRLTSAEDQARERERARALHWLGRSGTLPPHPRAGG